MPNAHDIITTYSRTGARLREAFFREQAGPLSQAALRIARSLADNGRLFVLGEGCGGICARAVVEAFLDRLDLDRPALPALLLPAGTPQAQDATAMRQLEALARPGDVLLAFLPDAGTTAVRPLLDLAQATGIACIAVCGSPAVGMSLPGLEITVPGSVKTSAPLVRELFFAAGHLVCRLTDHYLFENVTALQAVDPL